MARKTFEELWGIAISRKGEDEMRDRLPSCKSPDELSSVGDDRYLSAMAECVFSAGFVWRVVRAKWPGFEEAFRGFDPVAVAAIAEGAPGQLLSDPRIIRNGQKIEATFANARFVLDVAAEHGSFARFVADWPHDDVVGLWEVLAKRGSRLGGATGPRVLRMMGRDTFMLTQDVIRALTEQGVLEGKATSKRARRQAQDAFNRWHDESGRGLGEISVVLACTVPRQG